MPDADMGRINEAVLRMNAAAQGLTPNEFLAALAIVTAGVAGHARDADARAKLVERHADVIRRLANITAGG